MIPYTKGCFGCCVLWHIAGVSWPQGIVPGLISACVGYVLGRMEVTNETIVNKDKWVENPYPFHLYVYMVAFLLIFRTNFAYLRYWESFDAVQRIGAKWHDALCCTVSFDSPGDATMLYLSGTNWTSTKANGKIGPRHENFFNEMVHLFSLMHGLALMHLRCDDDLGNLEDYYDLPLKADGHYCISKVGPRPHQSGISVVATADAGAVEELDSPMPQRQSVAPSILPRFSKRHILAQHKMRKLRIIGKISASEYGLLHTTASGQRVGTLARVGMVESWIMRRWISRQKYETMGDMIVTSPPILSRLYQIISDGNLAFSQACKTAETPFPFPYKNLLRLFMWILAFIVPFMINSQVTHVGARFVINFMAIFVYFALCEVGDNLEDPYLPYDQNELPLELIQHNFNTRLLAMGILPHTPCKDSQRSSTGSVVDSQRSSTKGIVVEEDVAAGAETNIEVVPKTESAVAPPLVQEVVKPPDKVALIPPAPSTPDRLSVAAPEAPLEPPAILEAVENLSSQMTVLSLRSAAEALDGLPTNPSASEVINSQKMASPLRSASAALDSFRAHSSIASEYIDDGSPSLMLPGSVSSLPRKAEEGWIEQAR